MLAHILLLLLIVHFSEPTPIKKQSDKPPIIRAQLTFLPKKLPPKIEEKIEPELKEELKPELKQEPKPAESEIKEIAQAKPKPKPKPPAVVKTAKVEPKEASAKQQSTKTTQDKSVVAHFDPYGKIQDVVSQQNEVFFNSVSQDDQPQPTYTSVNSVDDPQIKAIFKTAKDLGNGTRIVNYGGTCMQIKRELDYNGFSRFNWTPSTIPCGLDSANKAQFKLSMDKFIKPKPE
jgi:hypothetical protein